MFRSTLWLLVAGTALGSSAAAETRVVPPAPLPLAWCLDQASNANPGIAAEAAGADAAHARTRIAGAFDDPRFSYEASNLPVGRGNWDFDSTPLSGHQLKLQQRLPFPGVLGGRRAAAEAGARAADLSHDDRARSVSGAVEMAWSELGFAQRALDITERNISLLEHLNSVVEAKYRVGRGLQQDVLRAQVELTALIQERLTREFEIAAQEARLSALLALPAGTPLPRTTELASSSPIPELASLVERLEQASPLLRSLSERVEQARRLERAARFEGYPDLDLGIGYRVRRSVRGDPVNGDDFVSAGFTIRLPVDRRRWRAQVAERAAERRRAEARHREMRFALEAELVRAHAELERANAESALLASGLVPQAQQSLESNRSGYQVGRVDLPGLLDSHVRLLSAELQQVRATADRRVAFATLEAAFGRGLR